MNGDCLEKLVKIIPRNCGPTRCAVHDGVQQLQLTTVIVEMSTLHEEAPEADDVDMCILHDGVSECNCMFVLMQASQLTLQAVVCICQHISHHHFIIEL